jgi:hypothetical protein
LSEIIKGKSQIKGKSKLENIILSKDRDDPEEKATTDTSGLIMKGYKFTPEVYQMLQDVTEKVNELTKRPVSQSKVMNALIIIASRHDPKEIKDAIIEAFY